jgi:hypothetical protein
MVDHRMRANELNLFNGNYVSIILGKHQSKEGGNKSLHNINIVSLEEKIKIQVFVDYHHINIENFPS